MAESDLEKGAEFTQIFNKHGGEEDPVIAAQRFLNIFRQLHIFTAAKRKEFDELLLKQPASVKGCLLRFRAVPFFRNMSTTWSKMPEWKRHRPLLSQTLRKSAMKFQKPRF